MSHFTPSYLLAVSFTRVSIPYGWQITTDSSLWPFRHGHEIGVSRSSVTTSVLYLAILLRKENVSVRRCKCHLKVTKKIIVGFVATGQVG